MRHAIQDVRFAVRYCARTPVAALVAIVVAGVALLASWIPARRATRIDPLEALRVE